MCLIVCVEGLFGSGRNDAGLGDLPSMDFSQKQARWIVVDVTSSLCEGKQQAPHGWKTAEASETSQLKIRYTLPSEKLSLDDVFAQQVTGVTGLPVWRNLAYLTAIQGGADHVLDADCSLPWAQQIDQLHFQTEPDQGLLYNSTLLFNPYAHFGAWAVVPKALVTAGKVNNSRSYYVRDFSRVLVKHGLSDRSHDAVAMHDSGHAGVDRNAAGIRFHYSSPPVFLGHRSFSAAVPWSSAYRSTAFWGLLLPCLNPSLLCHVLRLFIQQRLFRELDAFAGYYKLNTSSHRASVASFGEDLRFIHGVDVSDLASLLDTWSCEGNLTLYGCYRALADHLYSSGYLAQLEMKLMKSWIDVLQRHGVEEPVRIKTTWRGVRKVGEVGVIMGNLQDRLEVASDEDLLQMWKQAVGPVKERCANVSSSSSEEWFMHMGQWRTTPMLHDVVMIIVFNNHRYLWPNVAFLETMHRPFFRHIVYCLNRVPELLQAPEYRAWHHLVLLEGLSRGWFLMYGCVTTVIQMQLPGVRGYVMIGDDTLLNTWTVFNLPRDLVWLHPFQGRLESVARAKSKTGWQWWANSSGRCALLKAMAELELISGLKVQEIRKMIPGWNDTAQTFTEILHAATENLTCTSLPGSEVSVCLQSIRVSHYSPQLTLSRS